MNSQSLKRSSTFRLGIAAVSAALLPLLGGILPASAQSASPGVKITLPGLPGAKLQRITPMSPQQMKAMRPARTQPVTLPPVPIAKHPIETPMALADPSVLAGPRVALPGHVPGLVSHASKLEAVDSCKEMTITFALKPSHQKEMDDLARQLYDPKDPQFHKFLTPAERIARFSPTVEDFNKVVAFAQQSGLQVTDSSPDRLAVMATGTAAQIQNALGVHLDNYKAEDGADFYAPDSDPKVPQGIAPLLFCVQQLDNLKPKSLAIPRSSLPPKSHPGSGSGGDTGSSIQPDDIGIWSAPGMPAGEIQYCYQLSYSLGGIPLIGQGQHVALVEFCGFDQNDINYYIWYNANIASPSRSLNYTPIQIHGRDVGINSNSGEIELDIEMLEAITSGLDQIDVYEDGASVETELLTILNDDEAKQISISWAASESATSGANEPYYNSITEFLALQGQQVFVASGDWGSSNWGAGGSGLDVNYYAASPWVTGVGGTTLWINESNNYGAFYYENAWNDAGYATGGGISQYVSIPDYQYNYLVNHPYSWNSPTSFYNRNIPDVALDADPYTGYYTHTTGYDRETGGTSASAPLWAAFWAQLNEALQIVGESGMGFANPALYSIAEGGNYNNDFHDVYGGSNNGYYYPEYGYDCTTGLGSIDGFNMISDLLYAGSWSPSEAFYVYPSTVLSGQQASMEVVLNPTVSPYGYAQVVYAQLINNVWYQLGVHTINSNGTYDLFAITAPDVKTATQETYGCYVIYYDYNGQQRGGATWSNAASTTVYPNAIGSFTIIGPAYDGLSVTGTISLNAPAAQNEQIALTSSDPTHAIVPASVTVPAGQQSASFTITTKLVTTAEQVTITANPTNSGLAGSAITTQFTVAPLLSSVKLSPASVTGSLTGKGTVNLFVAAPSGGVTVTLKSANSAASVPVSITVPAGATSASFSIATTAVTTTVSSKITATHGAAVKSANLKVLPVGVGSLTLTPTSVVGGGSVTGTVKLAAPAAPGSITVSLSSNTPAVAYLTVTSITIPAGSQTGTFSIKTNTVSATTLVSITATANGISKSKSLKVTP